MRTQPSGLARVKRLTKASRHKRSHRGWNPPPPRGEGGK
jgi:hypothetical protein